MFIAMNRLKAKHGEEAAVERLRGGLEEPRHALGRRARSRDDPAWPGPVWGAQPPVPYGEAALRARLDALTAAFGAG